ncbi:MAG: MG2 domain-containing protein, partial [Flavobacteriaceae bacterium]
MTISAFSGLRRLVAGALLLSLGAVFMPASAQDTRGDAREIVLSRDTDFFGGDYETKKGISLDDCSRACVADSRCAAFTYNEKARWCFLKEKLGEAQSFAGATGGRIVVRQAVGEDEKAARLARLDFLPRRFVDDARRFAGAVGDRPLKSESVGDLVDAADAAREAKDIPGISDNYQDALRKRPEDGAMWGRFSRALLSANSDDWQMRRRATEEATNAAVLAVLNASDDATTGEGLALLGVALERNANWKPAIRAYRASLKAREMSWVSEALAKIEAQRGFRVVEHTVDSDAVNPRACVVFSDPIAASRIRAGDYVQVEGRGDIATEAEDRQICVDGVRHGERYRITVRSGLPASDGEVLKRNVDLDIYVRDRAPSVRFPGRAYVLPAGGEASIPVVTVNTDLVNVEVLRIGDRGLARTVGDDDFLGQLSGYDVSDIRDSKGQSIWKGAVEVRRELNRDMTTAIPVAEFTRELKPGVYVMIAKAANEQRDEYWEPSATQWFIVTDIGLTTLAGPQGLEVFARSLSGAAPVAGARVRLVAANDEILGNAVTDAQGRATLDPGLLAGEGGNAPALVVAETDGDYAFLDFTAAPFDLTDRGVTGRPAPKALDLYAVSDRGVYRPGEDVELTALVRNAKAEAVSGTPLTLSLTRPDGVEHARAVVAAA